MVLKQIKCIHIFFFFFFFHFRITRNAKEIYSHQEGENHTVHSEQLEQAVTAVKSGAMSIRRASEIHQVPKSTIADRVSGSFGTGAKPGRKPILPKEVEDKIVDTVMLESKSGMGVSRKSVKTYRHPVQPFKN